MKDQPEKPLSKRDKEAALQMNFTVVNTPSGRKTMQNLVDNVGVEARVRYFNMIEKRRSHSAELEVVKKVFDYGIIFRDGLELRGVDGKVFQYLRHKTDNIVEKRERIPK